MNNHPKASDSEKPVLTDSSKEQKAMPDNREMKLMKMKEFFEEYFAGETKEYIDLEWDGYLEYLEDHEADLDRHVADLEREGDIGTLNMQFLSDLRDTLEVAVARQWSWDEVLRVIAIALECSRVPLKSQST
ncbi:hypothetical protein BN2475_340173 [Paraburkholderia ribeironis]|uniref:CdiI immunity protein domain-containing protein n=1 Tax=Paraburkholderia ribeironis TaxID=1247936 RepID=A0A1N7S499_9BURK|nr:hypothetical protein [Paraburkholderia ribeironis]SIT42233.1 hypothetical protein BN2475_340173 [Paraburkholderia ribeironis]